MILTCRKHVSHYGSVWGCLTQCPIPSSAIRKNRIGFFYAYIWGRLILKYLISKFVFDTQGRIWETLIMEWLGLWCLTPPYTICPLYRFVMVIRSLLYNIYTCRLYCWYFELNNKMSHKTNFIGKYGNVIFL